MQLTEANYTFLCLEVVKLVVYIKTTLLLREHLLDCFYIF